MNNCVVINDKRSYNMDTVMSLTTGIISGIVSGWLVTEYYRKVDKRKEEREKRSQYYDIFTWYLNELMAEINIAEKMKEEEKYTEIYRMLGKKADYIERMYSVINESSKQTFRQIEQIFFRIQKGIENENISVSDIKKEVRNIQIKMLEIMAINMN